jgi:predicted Zn-dependent protease
LLSAALLVQNDLPGALAESQKSIDIVDVLAHDDPSNASLRQTLAEFHIIRASTLMAQKNAADGASEARKATDAIEPIAKRDPDNAMTQSTLAEAYFLLSKLSATPDEQRDFRNRTIEILTKLKDQGKLMGAFTPMLQTVRADASADSAALSQSSK